MTSAFIAMTSSIAPLVLLVAGGLCMLLAGYLLFRLNVRGSDPSPAGSAEFALRAPLPERASRRSDSVEAGAGDRGTEPAPSVGAPGVDEHVRVEYALWELGRRSEERRREQRGDEALRAVDRREIERVLWEIGEEERREAARREVERVAAECEPQA